MTGMKEGTGGDPFADSKEGTDSETKGEPEPDEHRTETTSEQPVQIPMILRRDSVQDGRDRVPLFLQEDTKNAEREALRELESRFDADIPLTDLREALVLAGLDRLDDVEAQLDEWGHGMTID